MKKYYSRILAVLLTAAMAMSSLPLTAAAVGGSGGSGSSGGSSTVPTSIKKEEQTAVATKWPGGGPKPADITLTTANVFFIGNYGQPDAAKVMFEIRGLTRNNIWKYDIGESIGGALYVMDDGVARIEERMEGVTAGKCSYSIRIYNYQETISYALEVKPYLAQEGSIPATIPSIPSLNPEPELEYWDTLWIPFNVQLPKGPDYRGLRGELVVADSSDVYAVTQPGEATDVYDTSESDARYDAIFGQENGLRVQCSGASLNLYCGKPLVVGNYDVKLYRGQTLVATVPKAMRATKVPIVRLWSTETSYQTGETAVYTRLNLSGGTLSDLNLSLWKDGKSFGTAGVPRIVGDDIWSSTGSFVIPVPGGLQSEGSYELKITSKSGTALEGQTAVLIHVNSDLQKLTIQQATYSNTAYANFIVKAVRVTPNTTYRVELSNRNTPLATIETKPSADGVFDLEFLDATGALIPLENRTSYNMNFSVWHEQGKYWRECGNAHVFTVFPGLIGAATLAAVESYPLDALRAGCNFSGETVEVSIETADKVNLKQLSDNSKFQLRMTSALGGQSSVLSSLTVTREPSDDPNITRINMSAPIPANTPHGYYNLELLYDGVPVIKLGSLATNVLTDGYPSEYSNKQQCSTMYTIMGKNMIPFGTSCDNLGGPKPVKIEFYRFGNFTATPEKTISKTLNDGGNAFTAADLSGLNLAMKYDSVLYLDGKFVGMMQTSYLGDEHIMGAASLPARRVTATQPANGTLELLPCGGGTADAVPGWTEVYVKSTPSPGYQLKPNSVKVNGQPIYGRGFLVTDKDCAVTAEFEPAPVKLYMITEDPPFAHNFVDPPARAAAGETVTLTVSHKNHQTVSGVYWNLKNSAERTKLTENAQGKYTFVMPAGDVVICAEYQMKPAYNITLNTPINGTLTVENPQAWEGDDVTLRTVPSAGYHLASLTVVSNGITDITLQLTGQSKGGYVFEMPANEVTVTATFAPGIGIELLPYRDGPSLVNVEGLTGTATLIVATYDDQGKMTTVAMAHLTGPVRWLKIPIGITNGSPKLFLLSDTGELKPLKFSRFSLL